jgi:hypothetical protein
MEGLFRIVAESFARHGIEVAPAIDVQPAESVKPVPEAPLTIAFPEHNYRQSSKLDPVP